MTTDPGRLVAAAILVIGWLVWTILRSRAAIRRRQAPRATASVAGLDGTGEEIIVAHASQTGVAAGIAERTAQALNVAGVTARVERLGALRMEALARSSRMIFVVSTCGEGDAPDDAWNFVRQMDESIPVAATLRFDRLEYALLALGDSGYRNFCAFGRRLDAWLCERGAQPLIERIDVDGNDEGALSRWSDGLREFLPGHGSAPPSAGWPDLPVPAREFRAWKLTHRVRANDGSSAEPVLRLRFEPVVGPPTSADWQAGDLARLRIPGEPACVRDYSIASLPADGFVELLVRQRFDSQGRAGKATAFLSGQVGHEADVGAGAGGLEPGGLVEIALLPNPGFRLTAAAGQPLILIAAGSGLAGVLGLLRERVASGAGPNWLLFGERESAHDFLCRDEILAWQRSGALERLDAVFSRDEPARPYIQDRLVEQAVRLRQWVDAGAIVHVCGSRERLAAGVEAVLQGVLGGDGFERLRADARYRRDVW